MVSYLPVEAVEEPLAEGPSVDEAAEDKAGAAVAEAVASALAKFPKDWSLLRASFLCTS